MSEILNRLSRRLVALKNELDTELSQITVDLANVWTNLSGLTDQMSGFAASLSTNQIIIGSTLLTDGNIMTATNLSVMVDAGTALSIDNATGVVTVQDLTVVGTQTTVSTADTEIKDNTIMVNAGETGSGVSLNTAGVCVDRGLVNNACILWDESLGAFTLVDDGGNYLDFRAHGLRSIPPSIEGGTNLSPVVLQPFVHYLKGGGVDTWCDISASAIGDQYTITVSGNSIVSLIISNTNLVDLHGAGVSVQSSGGKNYVDLGRWGTYIVTVHNDGRTSFLKF